MPSDSSQDHFHETLQCQLASARKEIEALRVKYSQLEKKNERLELIFKATGAGAWEWNIVTGEVTLQDEWARLRGYSLEELKPISLDTWKNACHPDDLQKAMQCIQKHLDGKRDHYECEIRMRHKDGHWVWVLDRGRITERNPDGTPLVLSGSHVDISGLKQIEQQYQEQSEELKALYYGINDAVIIADIETYTIIDANTVAEEMFGKSVDELIGLGIEQLHPPELTIKTIQGFKQQVQGPQRTVESRIIGENGKHLAVSIDSSLINYKGRKCLMGVFHDIHESKFLEERLRATNFRLLESDARYRAIFDHIQVIYVVVDTATGIIEEINPWVEALGYTREELLHTKVETYYAYPEEREQLYKELFEQRQLSDYEVHIKRKDGSIATMSLSISLREFPGQGLKTISALRDITYQKEHEEQILENVRLKNDFISTVSHELRTPLFSILGFSSLLLKNQETMPLDERKEFLDIIHDESTRLSNLIENVLTISRIDAGKDRYQPVVLEPAPIISEVVLMLRRFTEGQGLVLQTELPSESLSVSFDKDAFKQVLLNLIGNAIKFSKQGGSVNVRLSTERQDVLIEVIDTGIGIPLHEQEKIFDKFYRCKNTSDSMIDGSGLGLPIVKYIVELHGGRVSVSSELTKGSTFILRLPAARILEEETLQ